MRKAKEECESFGICLVLVVVVFATTRWMGYDDEWRRREGTKMVLKAIS